MNFEKKAKSKRKRWENSEGFPKHNRVNKWPGAGRNPISLPKSYLTKVKASFRITQEARRTCRRSWHWNLEVQTAYVPCQETKELTHLLSHIWQVTFGAKSTYIQRNWFSFCNSILSRKKSSRFPVKFDVPASANGLIFEIHFHLNAHT